MLCLWCSRGDWGSGGGVHWQQIQWLTCGADLGDTQPRGEL
jgi:hypothetical protein